MLKTRKWTSRSQQDAVRNIQDQSSLWSLFQTIHVGRSVLKFYMRRKIFQVCAAVFQKFTVCILNDDNGISFKKNRMLVTSSCPTNLFIQDAVMSKITVSGDKSQGGVINWISWSQKQVYRQHHHNPERTRTRPQLSARLSGDNCHSRITIQQRWVS